MKRQLFALLLFIPVLVNAQNAQMDPPAIISMEMLGQSHGFRWGPYFTYPDRIQTIKNNSCLEFNITISPPGYFFLEGRLHENDTTLTIRKGFELNSYHAKPSENPTIQSDRIIMLNNFSFLKSDSVFIFDYSLNQISSFAIDVQNLKGKRIDGNSLVTYRNKEEGFSIDYYDLNSGNLDSSSTVSDSLLSVKNIGNRSMLITKNGYSVHRFDSTTNTYSLLTHSVELPANLWQHGKDNSFNSWEPQKIIFYSARTGESKAASIVSELLLADEQTNGFVALDKNQIIYYANDLQEVNRFNLPENLQNADKIFLKDSRLIIQKSNSFGLFDLNGKLILEKEFESPFENIKLSNSGDFIYLSVDKTLLKISQQGQLIWQKGFPGGYIKDFLINNDKSLFVYHIDFKFSEAVLFRLENDEGRCQLKPQPNPISLTPIECKPAHGALDQFPAMFNGTKVFTLNYNPSHASFGPKYINSDFTYYWYKDGVLDQSAPYYDAEPNHYYQMEIVQGNCKVRTEEVYFEYPVGDNSKNPIINILNDPKFVGDELIFNGSCTNSVPYITIDSTDEFSGPQDFSRIID
ncbi:hypothetical protein [Jiulongibacter sediminis]|jgi:hypothetical protein|uniref:hypothetical protein n=1 Tax=Jiulongibacter sediminis TaxID=1605367 RepID=UPI0026F11BDE|nr:hypothetical protein [Jiulongibacter sediminis]